MRKVALIGAPTSGKTELAQQLQSALKDKTVEIVDGYIEDIERRSNVVLSHYATYLGNVQAAIGRFEAERLAESTKPDVVVTCGTLIENAVYTATLAFVTNQSAGQGDTGFRMVNDARANLTMSWLGVLKHDLWDYDFVYYLPLDSDDKWNTVVDKHIAEAAESMDVDYTVLPEDRDARVGIILQEILSDEATSSIEQASGDSVTAGTGDRSGHLPDVSE